MPINFSNMRIAYFSMEIGIENYIPTYSGGLGILAGDTLRSCAYLELPVVGVTLIYHKGYFKQKLNDQNYQTEEDEQWDPHDHLEKLPQTVTIEINGRSVKIAAWIYKLKGLTGQVNPIIFLDTNLPENNNQDRTITDKLYSGGQRHRIAQEMVLGIGGVKMLKALGCQRIDKYHMNEGHSAFLALELYEQLKDSDDIIKSVRSKCVFTTHTPVPAGHDQFNKDLVMEMLNDYIPEEIKNEIFIDNQLNMTFLALRFSKFINGVAKKHTEVSKSMFPDYHIESITNGIHAPYWCSPHFKKLFDNYLPGWEQDPFSLRAMLDIPQEEIWDAHYASKQELIEEVNQRNDVGFHPDRFTIGFARRFTAYKRPDLILHNINRLKEVAQKVGDIQIVFAGRAHPQDAYGKNIIKRIINTSNNLNPEDNKIKIAFLSNYNIDLAKLLVAGCDLWLNNPRRPYEASGTSGMKAAVNGVPQISTLDGWWLEGNIEGLTGWSIGLHPKDPGFDIDLGPEDEAVDLYKKLEKIIPLFYGQRDQWIKIMKHAIAINGSFFNTHRMVQEYVLNAYFK